MNRAYVFAFTITMMAVAAAGWLSRIATPVSAQIADNSHLRITSSVPDGGSSLDPVINNSIVVVITIEETGFPNDSDHGTLVLTPTNPPGVAWTCNECDDGFFTAAPVACATLDGCDGNDVKEWLVGVDVNRLTADPDQVVYHIDSTNLGNGNRFDSGPDCSDSVTPVDDEYWATDPKAAWDASTLCSNNGVSINLDYRHGSNQPCARLTHHGRSSPLAART